MPSIGRSSISWPSCCGRRREDPGYQAEWESFVAVLDAHAAEEERDLCPPPVQMNDDELNVLGDKMRQRMAELRDSTIEKLHVKGRTALLRTF